MTTEQADRYAAAADLVARSAAAFVSGVPEHPANDGYFSPHGVTWRLSADISSPIAGLRSLLMQALHPLAMAGVDQHSQWRRDPAGRLAATNQYVTTITYGDKTTADQAAAVVRRIHTRVRGTDEVTGQPYDANDPALLLWVHAALVDSTLAAARLVGTPPDDQDADRYVAEMVAAAELIGIPRDRTPSTVAGLNAYIESVRPALLSTPASAEAAAYLLQPAGLDPEIAEIWHDLSGAAIGSLPAWAIELYGFTPPANITREDVRQTLGMLDILYIGEPGVLEARQRIELARRAAESR
jgi:uncharacterized protein (DUF2236 family)